MGLERAYFSSNCFVVYFTKLDALARGVKAPRWMVRRFEDLGFHAPTKKSQQLEFASDHHAHENITLLTPYGRISASRTR